MAGPRKKILIVDDDKTVHTMLKMVLEKAGYQVFAALDAMQGLMMTRQVRPDLVILDLMMPAGGGISVYERLQMMSGTFQVPFLIYSSMERSEIDKLLQEGPTVAIVGKAAPVADILAAAERLLGA